MAEQKKQGWFGKLISWFASLPGRIAKAFKNMVAELRKVTWPSKKKLIASCITVMLFMLIVGAAVSLLDLGSAAAVNGLYSLSHPVVATEDESAVEGETVTEGETVVEGETPVEGETVTEGETPVEGETAETETTTQTDEVTEPAAE